ncbi:MAG: adenosylcobinamide-phosphate synthase CbiB, partial [Nitriliruptor sp.]|uniref:adenosylcobinamide-phosphate synthase CbiB n=1 Tax=Nitriliruptor sp. TaxID=2448056 RepID=UPI0034A04615
LAERLERRWYADDHLAGIFYVLVLAGGAATATRILERALPGPSRFVFCSLVTATALGGSSLGCAASRMEMLLRGGGLEAARSHLGWLCGRDATLLDADGLARATIESVAENTSDAVVGTLVWGAAFGPSGVVLHRAVNTLDAMVGYRSSHYRRFGWATARLDDAVNLLPARLTALLTVACAPIVGGRPRDAWQTWRRDAASHPSPNAGPVEAATAGALGVTLGGDINRYADHHDGRPAMGDGPSPTGADIPRAVRLSAAVGSTSLILTVVIASLCGRVVSISRRGGGA